MPWGFTPRKITSQVRAMVSLSAQDAPSFLASSRAFSGLRLASSMFSGPMALVQAVARAPPIFPAPINPYFIGQSSLFL